MPCYDDLDMLPGDESTSISRAEAEYLYALVVRLQPRATLEVGLGYGCSAAYVMAGAQTAHYAMDPLQSVYQGLGLKNIEKLGLARFLTFYPEYAHVALPRLLDQGVRVEFAFLDGGHRFDDIFIDFYYADLLLENGGHICLHDTWMRSTQTVASWVRRNKKNFTAVSTPMRNLALFRKTGVDSRPWYHFRGFATSKGLVSHSFSNFKRRLRRFRPT